MTPLFLYFAFTIRFLLPSFKDTFSNNKFQPRATATLGLCLSDAVLDLETLPWQLYTAMEDRHGHYKE